MARKTWLTKMNKMKVAGITLLAVGLTLLSIPLYAEWIQGKKVQALENALEMIDQQDGKVKKNKELPLSEKQLKNVMELEIPSIQLKDKVLPETNEENLSIALTQIKPNQVAGKGNFSIAGHRGYRGNRHFRKLPEVEKGNEIILRTRESTYVYRVNQVKVIEPQETDVLSERNDKSEITLITCTIDGKKRIAVKGQLE